VLGNRPAAELPVLMKAHGVLIAPTLADEWLLVVNEAMHTGLPVIGSVYAQAVTTLVQKDRTGWQYDPLHHSTAAKSLTPGLSDVMTDYLRAGDAQISAMREEAFRVVSSYTPRRSVAGVIDAIRSVLQSKSDQCRGCES
jgi:glycosyltransferase involved in cell wall biosynthesis